MGRDERMSGGRGSRLPQLRAVCCACGSDVDLERLAKADTKRSWARRPGSRELVEIDSACRDCGANRVKLVVAPFD